MFSLFSFRWLKKIERGDYMKKTLAVILTFIILTLSAVYVSAADADINGANWMSSVDGSLPVTAINMPGSHDCATQYIYASMFARTQSLSVLQQLYSGVRYLDVRLKVSGESILAVHSFLNCKKSIGLFAENLTAKDIVSDCRSFLEQNPGETVLFLLKQEDTKKDAELFSKFYDELIAPCPGLWYLENRIPNLDEVRGKIVLLRAADADSARFDDSNSGLNFESYPYIESTDIDDFRFASITSRRIKVVGYMYVQDSYMVEGTKKTETIANFFDSGLLKCDFNICCTNAHNKKSPYANAKEINAFLSSYEFKEGKTYGIVVMDFVTKELCEKIYMTNSPVMTNSPNAAEVPEFSESYAFLGRLFEIIRDFILKIIAVY